MYLNTGEAVDDGRELNLNPGLVNCDSVDESKADEIVVTPSDGLNRSDREVVVGMAGASVSSTEEDGNGVVSGDVFVSSVEEGVFVGLSVLSTVVVKIVDIGMSDGDGDGDGEVLIGLTCGYGTRASNLSEVG